MDKDKTLGHGGGFLPPSGRYSGYSPSGSSFNVKPEPSSTSPSFPPLGPGTSSDAGHFGHGMNTDSSHFSHDISRMPDTPRRNLGHRRAHSEILTLPDDISFDSDLGVVGAGDGPSFSDETEEDLLSMYLDMDKFNSSSATSAFQMGEPSSAAAATTLAQASMQTPASGAMTTSAEHVSIGSSERPRVRHQHSQSMDGSTTIKPEMLVSGSEDLSAADSKKAMSAAKLAELALIDPKRAKRIWANRQSAARSKERKMRYIAELERKVQTLQTEATSLSAQLTLLQRDTNGLTAENSELKLRLQTMEQQVHLQDALNDALKEEIQHLKVLTGQAMPNGGPMMNFASFGGGQQFYPSNQAMHTVLTTQQFQQLQIHSQKQQQQQQQQQQQLVDHQQIPSAVSTMSQFASSSQSQSPSLQAIPSLCQQQSFSDSNGNPVTSPIVSPLHSLLGSFPQDESSHLLNLPRTSSLISSTTWPSKRAAVEPLFSSGASHCVLPQAEKLGMPQANISSNSISLPPFPGRECSIDQGSTDPHSHLLFGVNIEPSTLLMQNGMSGLKGVGSDSNSTTVPFPSSNYMSTAGSDFSLNPAITPSSCIDESGFLQSPENVGQVNPPTRTFVKVHKSGSFGRSLDITKFSSYHELRGELAQMFGLEGELEDPLRSGWQLVFVDRENDVLLLGDDPWPEFVNSVWCIKILSPQEVQQMGKRGLELLNSVPIQRLSSNSCDDYAGRQDSRNLSSGITSVGSLEY